MVKNKTSIKFSIGVCFFVAAVLLGLVFFGPQVFRFYMVAYRGFSPTGEALAMLTTVFSWCFYSSAIFATVILYFLLKLLFHIKEEAVFIPENATCLKVISYCLLIIGIITFVGGFFYMPFMFVSAAGLFTGMLLRVLKNVFCSAIELREENDLTI
ncbi:MAG: DUF2975 domain-containing protein [Faecalimonas sp.]|nr:DUF2975 domain-containing protein [Faecalimonas sp.]